MAYQPIENYGIIGDTHTAALVGVNGSIDWFCLPHFDSPSVFASILDQRKGGFFRIAPPMGIYRNKQFYWPDTNVLITRFLSPDGIAELTDFMPIGEVHKDQRRHDLMRIVHVVHGTLKLRMECRPAFNFARDPHTMEFTANGVCFHSPHRHMSLSSRVPLVRDRQDAVAEFILEEGQSEVFYLREERLHDEPVQCPSPGESEEMLHRTVEYWHRWLSRCTYTGRWREMVHRAALALKLMTFEPTGAIVAAPTCSLPEWIGGERNWDYRYTWIRDAAFTLYGLLRIGFTEEARHFMEWLQARCSEMDPDHSLQTMYGIDGRQELMEERLLHLEGYEGSGPVRVGNAAYKQLQLDIYGELMDSVYLYNKHGIPISYDLWQSVRKLVDWVCDHWVKQDEGIWEVRSGSQHFVYSKLMCWVAVDRGIRLADRRSFPADRLRWSRIRDCIYEEIMNSGWSRHRNSFVQYYGAESLDASTLIMPLVFFLSPQDPRMLQTLNAILQSPARGGLTSDGLVYRYNIEESPDGLRGHEGTFNMCTFWLVEALTRAGRLREARMLFEKMLGYANHLGLYAEQTGLSGEALGNFPQAFTHISLISAAYNLDLRLGRRNW